MKLLAVETATEACSAALFIDGDVIERFQLAPREHTLLIIPMLDSLMTEAAITLEDLDALAFSRGPGSFTGLRIATGVIHGIAFGMELPVVPISTLAALAQDCFDRSNAKIAFAAMDARMGEVYWGVYQRDEQNFARLIGAETVGPAAHVACPDVTGFAIGSGWKDYREVLKLRLEGKIETIDADYLPKASAVARLGVLGFKQGQAVSVEQARPVYLRDNVAKKESER